MNCSNIQKIIRESDLDQLDADIREHLAQCPACKKEYESILALRNLIGLKKYEQPPAGFEQRNIDHVLRRIRDMETDGLKSGRLQTIPPRRDTFWNILMFPQPGFRYALAIAAVVVVLLGLGVVVYRRSLSREQIAQPPPPPSQADLATSSTNLEPAHIQYGPQPSKAADFKY